MRLNAFWGRPQQGGGRARRRPLAAQRPGPRIRRTGQAGCFVLPGWPPAAAARRGWRRRRPGRSSGPTASRCSAQPRAACPHLSACVSRVFRLLCQGPAVAWSAADTLRPRPAPWSLRPLRARGCSPAKLCQLLGQRLAVRKVRLRREAHVSEHGHVPVRPMQLAAGRTRGGLSWADERTRGHGWRGSLARQRTCTRSSVSTDIRFRLASTAARMLTPSSRVGPPRSQDMAPGPATWRGNAPSALRRGLAARR